MNFTISEIKNIPPNAGIYKYYDINNNLLYIGKAKNLSKRVSSYFINRSLPERTLRMVSQISYIFISVTSSETEALILENHLIRNEKPKYNIIFRDDKSYPYLKISPHNYPRLSAFRGKNIDNSILFGPYPNSYSLRDNIQMLQRIFKLRTCEDSTFNNRSKPCILFQIKRCSAPCVDFISQKDYQQDVQKVIIFLNGSHKKLFLDLENKMLDYAQIRNYEQAGLIRDQIKSLSDLFKQQNIDIGKSINIDVIAAAVQFNKICISVGIIRNGKHLGYKHFIQNMDIIHNELELEVKIQKENILENKNNLNNQEEEFLNISNSQELIIIYIEQQLDYINKTIPNLRILSEELCDENWKNIHEFMPYLKPYKLQNTYTKSWIKDAKYNAELHLKQFFNSQNNTKQQLQALNTLLNLNTVNPHIECFDISHTAGEFTKASCIVFKDGNFDRKIFRHYNIITANKGDDFEAMKHAVIKRYKDTAAYELPNLILIDGGLGQVHAVMKVFEMLNLPSKNIVGISKGEKRKVGLETLVFADGKPSITPSLSNLGLVLLTKIRDYAHDYAVLKMRKKRDKIQYTSELEKIEGVGLVKKKRLIAHFGGIRGIQEATVNEITQVHGVNQQLAERIYNYFHNYI